MTLPSLRTAFVLVAMSLLAGTTALAEPTKQRGGIDSTDWVKMQMKIKNKGGEVETFAVAKDCHVKFSDQAEKFPNPSLKDLKPGMYIDYVFEQTTRQIYHIDVIQVGAAAAPSGPVQKDAVVTAMDAKVGQIEVILNPGGRTTFVVDPKTLALSVKQGDHVTLLIETRGAREVVTNITKLPK
jgi:Cu/Ag efflux protein CusF